MTSLYANNMKVTNPKQYLVKNNNILKNKINTKNRINENNKEDKINKSIDMPLKYIKINNRRYLGNKFKLLDFIQETIYENCMEINSVADIFAGTGTVASAFYGKKIITNDVLYSNYICHYAWFGSENFSENKIIDFINKYNKINVIENNYVTQNFSNTFFSHKDCSKIGIIRENIEESFNKGILNFREKALLITSLLYAMDKIANTCGHYDAYRKNVEFTKTLELCIPCPEKTRNGNTCYNMDSNKLVKKIEVDLVYIDPPYNSRQYCDSYHILENIARWDKPEVFGIARKMDRSALKSDYCTTKATEAFEDLVKNIKAKYIVLSYNNMANKGNNRSNAKISDEDIMRILRKKGKVKVFSSDYKAFSTGKSNIAENEERLFLCECNKNE